MEQSDASRIQAAEAKASGGGVEKGGFASRAQVSFASPLADAVSMSVLHIVDLSPETPSRPAQLVGGCRRSRTCASHL